MEKIKLTDEQLQAISHIGQHARLLAGPGTGKTLVITNKIKYLISEKGIDPETITVITFTRAAAFELNSRVKDCVGEDKFPKISTLHSFALSQLLKNQDVCERIMIPLRIADDWEEKNIILTDIKKMMGEKNIRTVKKQFLNLSAGWDSLDNTDYLKVDPKFIGAWEKHKKLFGYTLRSELVYQLMKSLEFYNDFKLDPKIKFLIVDEFQDLNKCDLSIIKNLEVKGVELFVAGDDDQSIYGFRKAHPDGIRNFNEVYKNVKDLNLSICKRCDPKILELAEFVACQDVNRIKKKIESDHVQPEGEVFLINFQNQYEEANGIVKICNELITQKSFKPDDILILARSDRNKIFSRVLENAFKEGGIPFSSSLNEDSPLYSKEGLQIISLLRLHRNPKDHLAWKTLLQLRSNQIGKERMIYIQEFAYSKNFQFFESLESLSKVNSSEDYNLVLIKKEFEEINLLISEIQNRIGKIKNENNEEFSLSSWLPSFINDYFKNQKIASTIIENIDFNKCTSTEKFLNYIETSNMKIEQEIESGKINFLTMHKAKGLTSNIVFIIGCENEYIPGKQTSGNLKDDERRLFYVSLTRAKHYLFLTYCDHRIEAQSYSGTHPGRTRRHISDFLVHCNISKHNGFDFVL